MEGALNEFSPHVVIYNAGTDIMEGDCLGLLSVTKQVHVAPLLYFFSLSWYSEDYLNRIEDKKRNYFIHSTYMCISLCDFVYR